MQIRKTLKTHLNKILQMENDSTNIEFISPYDLNSHKEAIDGNDQQHLSVFDEKSKLIGFVILAGLQSSNNSIEFRRIVVSEKGKGYGNKIIEFIKKKCFEEFGCKRLWLDVFDFNARARHLYKKLGFVEEGVIRESVKTDRGYKNLVIMSVLKRDYYSEHRIDNIS